MNIQDIKKGVWYGFGDNLIARYYHTIESGGESYLEFDQYISGGKLHKDMIGQQLENITKIYKDELPIIAGEWYVDIDGEKVFCHGFSKFKHKDIVIVEYENMETHSSYYHKNTLVSFYEGSEE